MLMQPFCLWIDRSGAYSSSYEQDLFLYYFFQRLRAKIGRLPQGTYKIHKNIAGFQVDIFLCGCSHRLKDYGDRSLFPIIITDCQRDSLGYFVQFYDYELTRETTFSYAGCFYYHLVDITRQVPCFQNLVHTLPPTFSDELQISLPSSSTNSSENQAYLL